MKYVWEVSDIKPGVKVTKSGMGEVWMIGYRVELEKPKCLSLVSMSDGCVCKVETPEEIAKGLNRSEFEPYTGPVPKVP